MRANTVKKSIYAANKVAGIDSSGQRRAAIRQVAAQLMVSEKTVYRWLSMNKNKYSQNEKIFCGKKTEK